MKRYIRNVVFIACILVGLHTGVASAAIVSCTGFNSWGRSCDVCAEDRFYLGSTFSLWDWFHNTTPGMPEAVFSNSTSSAIIETMGHLTLNNGVSTFTGIVSGFSPAGKDKVIIFNPRGLQFTTTPANRDTIAARAVYNLGVSIGGGDHVITSNSWNYTDGVETMVWGVPFLTTSVITSPGTRSFYMTTPPRLRHVECQNLYVSWCGDGTVDANETCDPSDPARTGWGSGGCNASCAPVTVSCAVGTTTGAQSAPLTAASAGLCASGSSAVSSFSGVTSGNTTAYSWACNGISGGSCTASYTPSGGGGGGSSCNAGTTTGVQSAPLTATSTGLCSLGSGSVGNFSSSINGTTTFYSWSCDGVSGGPCSASYTTSGGWGGGWGWWWGGGWGWWWGGGWGWGWSSVPTGGTVTVPWSSAYCGNGIVERPNASGQRENCDTNALWCVACNIANTNPGSTGPGNLAVTNPGAGGSISLIGYRLIVGNGVPLFSDRDIILTADYPVYIENKTATVTNNSPLITGTTITKNVSDVGVGGEIRFENKRIYDAKWALQSIVYDQVEYSKNTVIFDRSELKEFRGDTSSFSGSTSIPYRDTPKTSSPSTAVGAFYTSLQFLETALSVRVTKPLVSNVAGGNAYIARPIGYDLNTVVANFLGDLKTGNFTSTTVNTAAFRGGRNLSSATKTVTSDQGINEIIASGSARDSERVRAISSTQSRSITKTIEILSMDDLLSKTERFSESDATRTVRGAHVRIGKDIALSGVRTIIVEDGDLLIDHDISYTDKKASYAFVVKKGNIVIADTVRKITWVYVTLTGSIQSNGISTATVLTVEGSLYGHDLSDLSDHRTYARGDSSDTALSVGVVVNYSNRALVSPPPLLSQFLEQYSLWRVKK